MRQLTESQRAQLEAYMQGIENNMHALREAVYNDGSIEGNILHRAKETQLAADHAFKYVKSL